MRYCKRCLYSENHALNIVFDKNGLCSGCVIHEEKDSIDWKSREKILKNIFKEYKNKSHDNYDCIVPVSGARDSYFIVHLVKNIYKMNPLLVTYNKHYNTDVGVRNLANLRIKFDCDIMTLTVDPEIVKKITRSTLRKFGSIYWHCISGQTVFPVQTAVKFKIPLIVWGAHQGLDQVGMFSHLDQVEMTRKYRKEHDLMGFEAEDLVDDFDEIEINDVKQFIYPDDKEIEMVGVRGIYLNNFIRWDSRDQHEEMINKYGFETLKQNRTFDYYNDVDCYNYSDVHDYIKFLKHGYGKVVDHAVREIRLRKMTREEGIKLVEKYINKKPKNLKLFLDWLGIKESSFNYIINQHRNEKFWYRDDNWVWKIKDFIKLMKKHGDKKYELKQIKSYSDFTITKKGKSSDSKNNYILIGKGYK